MNKLVITGFALIAVLVLNEYGPGLVKWLFELTFGNLVA